MRQNRFPSKNRRTTKGGSPYINPEVRGGRHPQCNMSANGKNNIGAKNVTFLPIAVWSDSPQRLISKVATATPAGL
jgi:hypothetical protein